MSACSSQLSPSLLAAHADEVDSASTAYSTKHKQPRSASANRFHTSGRVNAGSKSSRLAAGSTSQPKQRSDSRAASTLATPQSPVLPAESVASQGHRANHTPQSSASTGHSHASSGSGISSKPRWQQSTAASSRSQRSGQAPHPSSKQSFLTRLQAQAGQVAPDKQQQYDAKAAEMKAKLQEWRQQQKQQKQQQQQQRLAQKQGPSDVSGRPLMPAKKPVLQQPRLGRPTGKPMAASVDSVRKAAKEVSVIKHTNPSSQGTHADQNTPANFPSSTTGTLPGRSSSHSRLAAASSTDTDRHISPAVMLSHHASAHMLLQQAAAASGHHEAGSNLHPAVEGTTDWPPATSTPASALARHTQEQRSADLLTQEDLSRQPFRSIHRDSSAPTTGPFSRAAAPPLGHPPAQHAVHPQLPGQMVTPPQEPSSLDAPAQQRPQGVQTDIRAAPVRTDHADEFCVEQRAEVARRSDGSSLSDLCSSSGSFDRGGTSQKVGHVGHMGNPVSSGSADTAASSSSNVAAADAQAACAHQAAAADAKSSRTSSTAVHSAGVSNGDREGSPTGSRATAVSTSEGRAGLMEDAPLAPGRDSGPFPKPSSRARAGGGAAGRQRKSKAASIEEANLQLQCERWRHLQWRFLNCKLEDAMVAAKPKAEQGLAAAALYVAEMRKEVNQRQAELWAAERERRVGAALAGQLPRLQRWQSMQAEQRANSSAVQSALSHALQHVPMTNGANTGGSTQDADAPAVAQGLSKLRDALRSSQQHVHSLMGSADDLTISQCSEASDTDTHVTPSTTGGMRTTARTATELAETSQELKHYLGMNSLLLEQYSHELLHVQSLAAQLVQMSNMQHQPQ